VIVRKLDHGSYCTILNRKLPKDIRMLAYANLSSLPYFDARFSCVYREYTYFFHADNLDIDLVRKTAIKFIGEHDFRNFCKADGPNPDFTRQIFSFDICPASQDSPVYRSIIKGSSFLYHQVRIMMSILFLVGSQQEQPELVDLLLADKCS
jgi:tRNA pseudouridine38/39 synthase